MLKIFNTLSNKKEVFKTDSNLVKIYGCGPTVYDHPHIGNFRTFIFYDLLIRTLHLNNYDTQSAINITDIDDKIISRSIAEKKNMKDITLKYEKSFIDASRKLKILKNEFYPRATDHVEDMIAFIQKLVDKNYAYVVNGNVYFDIKNYSNYGKFVNLKTLDDDIENDLDKKNKNDFALWKAWKSEDGNIFWESAWGKGRPAWHTECAVISQKILGNKIDIHCGGIDLKFPHHENECAQIESITNKNFANYWLHSEHLNIEDEKMSKSLGNSLSIEDMLKKYSSNIIRMFLLSSHYRSKISLSKSKLEESKKMINRISRFAEKFNIYEFDFTKNDLSDKHQSFINAINDDLNTPKALGIFFEFISDTNKALTKRKDLKKINQESIIFLNLFNSIFQVVDIQNSDDKVFPQEINELLLSRQQARDNKDWILSDKIRDKLFNLGWIVEDSLDGQKLLKKK